MVNLEEIFALQSSLLEVFIRASCIYLALFALLRFIMKRPAGDVNVTDMLVIVLIADASQNGMVGEAYSVTNSLLTVITIILWDYLFDWLSYKYEFFGWLVHPAPIPIIKNGRMIHKNMRKEFISREELMSQLRENGVEHVKQVKTACIESDGNFSIVKFDDK